MPDSAPFLELVGGRAAQMGADADDDEVFRLDRAFLALDVIGLHRALRLRVGDLVVDLLQRLDHFLGAVNDPHRLAAPLDAHHLARGELADIGFDRGAGRLGALGGEHAGQEGHRRCDRRHAAHGRSGENQVPPAAIHFLVTAHGLDFLKKMNANPNRSISAG